VTTAKALEIWSAQSLCDIGILLSIASYMLHVGRPYFERIQSRLTLRVAADLWWLGYIALRDGALFVAVICGFFCLNLDLMADIKIGLPFVPLGTVALVAAMRFKVFRNTEDSAPGEPAKNWRLVLYLVGLGALLNTIGYVLVMEAPGEEYEAAKSTFWHTMKSWRSNANPALATVTFYVAFALLGLLAVEATIKCLRLYRRAGKDNTRVSD
jgi:hypothetical protein